MLNRASLLLPPNRSALESAVVDALHTLEHPERLLSTLYNPDAVAAPLLPFVLMLFFKRDRLTSRSRGAAWACGYEHEQSMVITAHGFAMPVKENFAAVLKLRHWLNPVGWVPGWQSAAAPALFRRLAVIELAVLVVIVISRGA